MAHQFADLNTKIKDVDSVITGYGKHDRVVAFQPQGNTLYVRVDHGNKLGKPTAAQVLKAAKAHQDIRGAWNLKKIEPWDDGSSTDYHFERKQANHGK